MVHWVLNIFLKASSGLSDIIILAELFLGPTIIKSLYIKLNRFTPKPFSTKSNSLFFAWTIITSPSQFEAFFKAAPVPTETT